MLLMSVVENAVKHGVEPKADGGTIRIEAQQDRRDAWRCRSSTADRGLAEKIGNGVGTHQSARAPAGAVRPIGRASLLQAEPGAGVRATIEVPE